MADKTLQKETDDGWKEDSPIINCEPEQFRQGHFQVGFLSFSFKHDSIIEMTTLLNDVLCSLAISAIHCIKASDI